MKVEKIIEFLKNNKIDFVSPGSYCIPSNVIIEAINEFIETGKSSLINKHQKWTWYGWSFDELQRKGECIIYNKLNYEELIEYRDLKLFWKDYSDLAELSNLIYNAKQQKEIERTYKYRRKVGFSVEIKRKCLKRDNDSCVKCDSKEKLEIDHIISLIKGGDNTLKNAQTLCKKCHRKKTTKDLK